MTAPLPIHGHRDVPTLLAELGLVDREELVLGFADDPEAAKAFEEVELVPPDQLVDDEQRLDLGGRTVLLRHLRRGHTGNDLVVQMPEAGALFAGHLVEEAGPPALAGLDAGAAPAAGRDWPFPAQALEQAVQRAWAQLDGRLG